MREPVLKPCPFCGGEARLIRAPFSAQQLIICRTCGCRIYFDRDAKQTAAAWNRRAGEEKGETR